VYKLKWTSADWSGIGARDQENIHLTIGVYRPDFDVSHDVADLRNIWPLTEQKSRNQDGKDGIDELVSPRFPRWLAEPWFAVRVLPMRLMCTSRLTRRANTTDGRVTAATGSALGWAIQSDFGMAILDPHTHLKAGHIKGNRYSFKLHRERIK